jgi:hypothetical protein
MEGQLRGPRPFIDENKHVSRSKNMWKLRIKASHFVGLM